MSDMKPAPLEDTPLTRDPQAPSARFPKPHGWGMAALFGAMLGVVCLPWLGLSLLACAVNLWLFWKAWPCEDRHLAWWGLPMVILTAVMAVMVHVLDLQVLL